jgi:Trypsin-like peptidase domain
MLLAGSILCACSDSSDATGIEALSVVRQGVIYGQDDRVEALDYLDTTLAEGVLARTGVLVPRSALSRSGADWILSGPSLRDELPLCEGERYVDQLRIASCTAMLVQSDVIMTAGHCMDPELGTDYVFVRGYYLSDSFPLVPADDVIELERVLSKIDGDLTSLSAPDLAIVRLRTAQPLPAFDLLGNDANLVAGEQILVAGASEGLPIKIDDGATVFTTHTSGYFEITSDTFRGSSGSPVFAQDGHLLGMLVGGAADYEWTDDAQCYRRLAFDAPIARGELVVGVTVMKRELDAAQVDASAHDSSCAAAALPNDNTNLWHVVMMGMLGASLRGLRRRSTKQIRINH